MAKEKTSNRERLNQLVKEFSGVNEENRIKRDEILKRQKEANRKAARTRDYMEVFSK